MASESLPPVRPAGTSLTQDTYEGLRRLLLQCDLEPSSRLNVKELVAMLDSNSAAVREALSRLTAEGLVIAEPQRGFSVAPVSLSDLTDLTSVRMQIESSCLEQSVDNGDLEWEARVVSVYHRLSRTGLDATLPSPSWNEAHSQFHQALVSACPSAWLLRLRGMLFEQYGRYRALSVAITARQRNLDTEHEALFQAAIARDSSLATRLMRQHIQYTAKALQDEISLRIPAR